MEYFAGIYFRELKAHSRGKSLKKISYTFSKVTKKVKKSQKNQKITKKSKSHNKSQKVTEKVKKSQKNYYNQSEKNDMITCKVYRRKL